MGSGVSFGGGASLMSGRGESPSDQTLQPERQGQRVTQEQSTETERQRDIK